MEPAADEYELRCGDVAELVLESRGAAGYRWSLTIDDARVVAVAAVPTFVPPPVPSSPGPPPGERFAIEALARGEATVRFELRRPFGPVKPPLATRTVRVVVRT